jgi:hypothetical protein
MECFAGVAAGGFAAKVASGQPGDVTAGKSALKTTDQPAINASINTNET